MSANVILDVGHVSKIYGQQQKLFDRIKGRPAEGVRAVSDVSFSIAYGQTMGLVGESGCGKSTIARLVSGLIEPTSGKVELSSTPGKVVKPRLQMIFQDPFTSLNGRWTIARSIAEPIVVHGLRNGKPAIRARVDELLEMVGLAASDGEKYPQEFSGGQRQRICIARALAGEPDFLILDEPTSALDVSVQAQVLQLLRDLQTRLNLTSLFITHNLSVVRIMADRIGVMYLGELIEEAPAATLFESPKHPYTRLLIDAAPSMDVEDRDLHPIRGELPSPSSPPRGCRFHTRCPFVQPKCRDETPMAHTRSDGGMFRCHFDLDLGQAGKPVRSSLADDLSMSL